MPIVSLIQLAHNVNPCTTSPSTSLPNPPHSQSKTRLRIRLQKPRRLQPKRQPTKYSILSPLLLMPPLPRLKISSTTTSYSKICQSSLCRSPVFLVCRSGITANPLRSYKATTMLSFQVHPTLSSLLPSRQKRMVTTNMRNNVCTKAYFCNIVINWVVMV